uniref:Uncharacterized protein n=1 Tax=Timema shepardi TaxID=629360 RepID=A0A7R9G250_TIMSH|nr:unnamed protein product [Timema shepardi]
MHYSVVTLALLVLSVGVTQGKPGRHDKQPGVTHAPVTAAMTTTHVPVMAAMTTAADTDMAAEEQENSSSEESGSSSQEKVEEGFGNQINLCPDRGLNPGPPAPMSDTLPLECQVT